ncbi:UDP-N-acetylenolpyruvoylglucosamine reductase, partial [mine drainage metagenome]
MVSLSSSEVLGEVFEMYRRGEIPGPLAFVGRGSNILFPDTGLGGTLVRFEHGDGASGCRWFSDGSVDVDA